MDKSVKVSDLRNLNLALSNYRGDQHAVVEMIKGEKVPQKADFNRIIKTCQRVYELAVKCKYQL